MKASNIMRHEFRCIIIFGILLACLSTTLWGIGKDQTSTDLLEAIRRQSIESLLASLEAFDPATAQHCRQVSVIAQILTTEMNLAADVSQDITRAGLLHDAGKLDIPLAILNKPGKLTSDEFARMRTHPETGWQRLIRLPGLARYAAGSLDHHERYDGSGYPKGSKEIGISWAGRILAVADTLDAMTSPRPYQPARSFAEAEQVLLKGAGPLYDRAVVDAFTRGRVRLLEYVQHGRK